MDQPRSAAPSNRLLSLDAFRGLDIILMFLVNTAGNDPAFPSWFEHRGYNEGRHGNGLADFVFPWFLFIVGCAIPFSMASGRGKGLPLWRRLFSAFRRGLTIYLLGTLMWCASIGYRPADPSAKWWGPIDLDVFLHWDILPLIGFAYIVGAFLSPLPRWVRGVLVGGVLLFKWISLTQMTYPGTSAVLWTSSQNYDGYIKSQLGWFGVMITQGLPAAALVVLGTMFGQELQSRPEQQPISPQTRIARLAGIGAILTAASYALHRWNMPYSKDFLTSSYVMLMAGSGAMLLALMYWIIDVRQWSTMLVFRVMGMNAIAMYVLAELMWKTALVRWQVVTPDGGSSIMIASFRAWLTHWTDPMWGPRLTVLGYIAFYWFIAHRLYRAKMYFKV
jgi:predicted acyltransferase